MSGGKVMLGGPAFAAEAAVRSGAGLAVFLGEEEVLARLIRLFPQAIGMVPPDDLAEAAKKWRSIIIGPGLGINKDHIKTIDRLLRLKLPAIIDADGINLLAAHRRLADGLHEACLLTPHPKEFERLAETFNVSSADGLAAKFGCVVVLKGSDTYVTDGVRNWCNETENPALATGGTGDVLSGIAGGPLAQYFPKSLTAFECAQLAVEIHSRAAAEWRARHGSGGLVIGELLALIPETMEKMRA